MIKNLIEKLCPSDLREQRGAATKLRLVDAAIRLFGEKGFKAVSVRELADHALVVLLPVVSRLPFLTECRAIEWLYRHYAPPITWNVARHRVAASPENEVVVTRPFVNDHANVTAVVAPVSMR